MSDVTQQHKYVTEFSTNKRHAKCLPTYFLDYNETVVNPDPEVRSCGRVQNAFQSPLPTSTKLRVNCPVLYMMMMMMMLTINENINITT